jgi:hypothetical protein
MLTGEHPWKELHMLAALYQVKKSFSSIHLTKRKFTNVTKRLVKTNHQKYQATFRMMPKISFVCAL